MTTNDVITCHICDMMDSMRFVGKIYQDRGIWWLDAPDPDYVTRILYCPFCGVTL